MNETQFQNMLKQLTDNEIFNLDLSFQRPTKEQVTLLAGAIKINISLQDVNLTGIYLDPQNLKEISAAVSDHPNLKELILTDCKIDDKGIAMFSHSFINNKSIRYIKLDKNKIGPIGAKNIAEFLQSSNVLSALDLSNNPLGENGCEYIVAPLIQNVCLKTLNLTKTRIGKGAKFISNMLLQNIFLENLILAKNNIDNEGGRLIADSLAVNTTLASIDLSGNDIDSECAQHFVKVFKKNSTINKFKIESSNISPHVMKILSEVFSQSKKERPECSYNIEYKSTYNFESDNVAYIKALATYNKYREITKIYINNEPVPVNDTLCHEIPKIISKLPPEKKPVHLECSSIDSTAIIDVLPAINNKILAFAVNLLTESTKKNLMNQAMKIFAYCLNHEKELRNEAVMAVEGLTKPRQIFTPPYLEPLNIIKAFAMLAYLDKISKMQTPNSLTPDSLTPLNGAVHFSSIKCIVFYMFNETYVLNYSNLSIINIIPPFNLDIDDGFYFKNVYESYQPIINELQKLFITWKENVYQGAIIPDHLSGFSDIVKYQLITTARAFGSVTRFFGLPNDLAAKIVLDTIDDNLIDKKQSSSIVLANLNSPKLSKP